MGTTMSKENTRILHGLMTDMQLAYYWAFLFDAKGEPREITEDTMETIEAGATRACKSVALRAIKNKTIPKRMYVYANAFAVHTTPMEVVDKTYHLYTLENTEATDESLDKSA